jgi:hypothetical protein
MPINKFWWIFCAKIIQRYGTTTETNKGLNRTAAKA